MSAILARPPSMPERLALFGVALVPAAVVYPWLTERTSLHVVCPLRALTSVPCPMCGGTTAATYLVDGRLSEALAANPLVPVLAVLAAAVLVVMGARSLGWAAPPAPWSAVARRAAVVVFVLAAVASWTFQVQRVGLL